MALKDNLIAHWKLDEASGTRFDSHGNNDLTNVNGTATSAKLATGWQGGTVTTDGYLFAADNAALSSGDSDFTFACWIWFHDIASTYVLFCKHNDALAATEDFEYRLYFNSTLNRFLFDVGNDTTSGTVVADNFGGLSANTWYFVVCKHDSVNNEISIKVNDGTADTESYTGGSYDSNYRFYLGGQNDAGFLVGILDSVSYWGRLTTSQEDTDLYNAGAGLDYDDWDTTSYLTDNLISHWDLDEASGTRADSHGTNDLTDVNTVGSTTGKISNAADFVAANSERLSHNDNADLSTGDIDFTLAGWVYFDTVATSQYLASKYSATEAEWIIFLNDSDMKPYFGVYHNGVDGVDVGSGLSALSADTWYFVVAWHNAGNDTINIQVNNGAVDTRSHSLGVGSGAAVFTLGGLGAGDAFHDGRLDEWAFWKRVLTSGERTELYNAGSGLAYASWSTAPADVPIVYGLKAGTPAPGTVWRLQPA